MLPEDERHATTRGYHAGCRERCCMAAINQYQKTIRFNAHRGERFSVPAIGSQRRIQALMALGWTGVDIAAASGMNHQNHIRRILVGQKGKPCTWVERKTHEAIKSAYDELSMRLPSEDMWHRRARTWARNRGWLPPLAWDDESIDQPEETLFYKNDFRNESPKDYFDHVVVERFLAGDTSLKPSLAEKREIVRRWPVTGRPLADLERLGWKPERYLDRTDGAA